MAPQRDKKRARLHMFRNYRELGGVYMESRTVICTRVSPECRAHRGYVDMYAVMCKCIL